MGNSSLWGRIVQQLRHEEGEVAFQNWISPLKFDSVQGGVFRVLAPSLLIRDWVDSHYRHTILSIARHEDSSVFTVDIAVGGSELFPDHQPINRVEFKEEEEEEAAGTLSKRERKAKK